MLKDLLEQVKELPSSVSPSLGLHKQITLSTISIHTGKALYCRVQEDVLKCSGDFHQQGISGRF